MCGITRGIKFSGVDLIAEYEISFRFCTSKPLTNFYLCFCVFFIIGVGGFIVYIMLRPLWFSSKKNIKY